MIEAQEELARWEAARAQQQEPAASGKASKGKGRGRGKAKSSAQAGAAEVSSQDTTASSGSDSDVGSDDETSDGGLPPGPEVRVARAIMSGVGEDVRADPFLEVTQDWEPQVWGVRVSSFPPPTFPESNVSMAWSLEQFDGQPPLPTEAEDQGETASERALRPVPGSALALKAQYPVGQEPCLQHHLPRFFTAVLAFLTLILHFIQTVSTLSGLDR